MAELTSLSNELLDGILTLLATDKSTLCALAIANRRFSKLAQRHIFEHLEVWVPVEPARNKSYDGLIGALKCSPEPAKKVRSVKLQLTEHKNRQELATDSVHERANAFLAMLPNIQILEINDYHYQRGPFIPDFLETTSVPKLREVRLFHRQLTVNEAAKYFRLQGLETLYVRGIRHWYVTLMPPCVNMACENGRNTSILKLLDLGFSYHLPPPTLRSLLSVPQSIRALHCTLPGYQPPLLESNTRCTIKMLQPLSPRSIVDALAPLQHCLVELDLKSGIRTHWSRHDGSRLDLSLFAKLEVLTAPALCFFPVAEGAWADRMDAWMLLPPCLRRMTIIFELGQAFLYHHDEVPILPPEYVKGAPIPGAALPLINTERWAWLLDLGDHLAHIPGLESIEIEEKMGGWKRVRYGSFWWDIPSELKRAFEVKGVRLRAWLRDRVLLKRAENGGLYTVGGDLYDVLRTTDENNTIVASVR